MKDVRVDQLQPGDVLNASGFIVESIPFRSIYLKASQRHVTGKYPNGTTKTYTWNAATMVRIKDDG